MQMLGPTNDVIGSYIKQRTEVKGELVWNDIETAPGTDVKARAIRIICDGEVTSDVRIDREIVVELEYETLKPGVVLIPAIHLRDSHNGYVLVSGNMPSANTMPDPWFGKPHPAGHFRTRCVLPANLLNDVLYSVDVGISNNRQQWMFNLQNALSFQVHETGEMTAELTSGSWVGVVRPKLRWQTELLEDKQTGNGR
jgi:lipopolysaccharide transport system ATP-binding protein